MYEHTCAVHRGERFEFGKNWKNFLSVVDEQRIHQAQMSLTDSLDMKSLDGLSFADIGCGSGLFSLAARNLQAKVHSFDCDPEAVECTRELKSRFVPQDSGWTIEQGSALDNEYLAKIGRFDIVYAWGSLHHTGAMWRALDNVDKLVKPGGRLFLSIYNYQVYWSSFNLRLKRLYNRSPKIGKWIILTAFMIFQASKGFVKDLLFLRSPIERYRKETQRRGMSLFYNWIDWVGGYPFEVAKPEWIFEFYQRKGYLLNKLKTDGGHGCNEFVFRKVG